MSAEGENDVNNVSAEEDKKVDGTENENKTDEKSAKVENDITDKAAEKPDADEKCKEDIDDEKDEKPKEGEEKSNGENKAEEESEKDDAQSDEDDNKDDTMDASDGDSVSPKKSPKPEKEEKDGKLEIPDGKGSALGDIPRIDASISRFKNDDLKTFHQLLFGIPGKITMMKKNIKKFHGFDFDKDSDEFDEKLSTLQGTDLKQLKSICEMIDLEKKGSKEDIAEKILVFLLQPKDSGKPAAGGRPKRASAVKANNRGYSSHDDSDSDERMSPRGRGKGRRPNLKDETSSNASDEDFQPSDVDSGEEQRPRRPTVSRRKRTVAVGRKKRQDSDEEEEEEDDDLSEELSEASDDSDEPKAKKRKPVNNKPKRGAPAKRGRKPKAAAPVKRTPAKRGKKKKAKPASSEDEDSDRRSSSEDEPLVKKKSPQPPTDDEIKTYVKHILEGANLEEITMKTVCKQVYAHYPDFDLTHKKDYIKSTVKSLIST